jgi:hypothetical protein
MDRVGRRSKDPKTLAACVPLEFCVLSGCTNFSRVGPVHAADFLGHVTAIWLKIRR